MISIYRALETAQRISKAMCELRAIASDLKEEMPNEIHGALLTLNVALKRIDALEVAVKEVK